MEERAASTSNAPNANVIEIVLPTYQLKPEEGCKFIPAWGQKIAKEVVEKELKDKEYDEDDSKEWAITICDKIKKGVMDLKMPRYKIIVQVNIGQMKDQGVRVASRCLWDTATDNYASSSYQNETLWCSAMIFAIYAE